MGCGVLRGETLAPPSWKARRGKNLRRVRRGRGDDAMHTHRRCVPPRARFTHAANNNNNSTGKKKQKTGHYLFLGHASQPTFHSWAASPAFVFTRQPGKADRWGHYWHEPKCPLLLPPLSSPPLPPPFAPWDDDRLSGAQLRLHTPPLSSQNTPLCTPLPLSILPSSSGRDCCSRPSHTHTPPLYSKSKHRE